MELIGQLVHALDKTTFLTLMYFLLSTSSLCIDSNQYAVPFLLTLHTSWNMTNVSIQIIPEMLPHAAAVLALSAQTEAGAMCLPGLILIGQVEPVSPVEWLARHCTERTFDWWAFVE